MTPPDDVAVRVPDLVLERYRLSELPPADARALERRLRGDTELQARLQTLARSDEEIRRLYPPAWLAERIRSRLPASSPPARPMRAAWSPRWTVPTALAVSAAVLLVLAPQLLGPPPAGPGARRPAAAATGDHDRIKGSRPALELFRKTPDGSEALADGAQLRGGDIVRIGYRAAGRGFGAILSIDGRGAVTLHLPVRGERAAALESGGTVLLDHAYELDDAPRFERFHFVTSPVPFELAPILAAARSVAATPAASQLPLSTPFEQSTFLLRKGGRP